MITPQAELAKELLNNHDSTVEGILLGASVILLTMLWTLWKQNLIDKKYIREQDKANLEMLLGLTNTIDKLNVRTNESHNKMENIKLQTSNILQLIQDRLTQV